MALAHQPEQLIVGRTNDVQTMQFRLEGLPLEASGEVNPAPPIARHAPTFRQVGIDTIVYSRKRTASECATTAVTIN
jgi:hypothetical protein